MLKSTHQFKGDFAMTPEQRKRITYDLSIEYLRQHQLLSDVEAKIPDMVEHFASVCEKFDSALKESSKMQNLF